MIGTGTSNDPFQISSYDEFLELSSREGAEEFDIVCLEDNLVWDMTAYDKIGKFGIEWKFHSFDGKGLIIKNLYFYCEGRLKPDYSNYVPMISLYGSNNTNTIKNISFQNFSCGGPFGDIYFMEFNSNFNFINVNFIGELQTNRMFHLKPAKFYNCLFSISYKPPNTTGGTFFDTELIYDRVLFYNCILNVQGLARGGYGDYNWVRCLFYGCKFIGDFAFTQQSGMIMRNTIMNCMFNDENVIIIPEATNSAINASKMKGRIDNLDKVAALETEDFYNPLKLQEANLTVLGDTYE